MCVCVETTAAQGGFFMANNTIAVLRQMLASLDDAKKYQSLRDVMSTLPA